jgi:hypothetical protein
MNLAESLTEEMLLMRLRGGEHDFVERKPKNQQGEWLQVAVAFANSTPIGFPAVLFAGADDEGNPQYEADKLEHVAKSVNGVLDQAFPAIYRHIVPLRIGAKGCLAVIIPGSPARPHFAGKSYIRVGPEVRPASQEQFDELVAYRQSKAYEILNRKEDAVRWVVRQAGSNGNYSDSVMNAKILNCNSSYMTVKFGANDPAQSFPLSQIEIGFDHVGNQLQIFHYTNR